MTVPPTAQKTSSPWRGSFLTYGHAATTVSLDKGALPFYNPTYAHRLELGPQWNFNDLLFVRARLELMQEFTVSDTYENPHEIVVTDLMADVGTSGWEEPRTGIRISGDLRLTAPTSKIAQAQSRILSVGPRLSLSRKFPVMQGLTVRYDGRYTYRFNRYTTMQNEAPRLIACTDVQSLDCLETAHTGRRNVEQDVVHGATVLFQPLEKLSVTSSLMWSHGFLYALTPSDIPVRANPYANENFARFSSIFSIGASYQIFDALDVGAGVLTVSPLGEDGSVRTPFFNQFTTLYLDLGVDFEALLSRS
ncbi:MAG: hypothetical protein WBV82_16495 [Myxococcaceae bacterium]